MPTPPKFADVKAQYDKAWQAVKALAPIGNTAFDVDLAAQADILNGLAKQMVDNPPVEDPSTTPPVIQANIDQLKDDITLALNKSEMFISTLRDNRKLHYQEAGQWARHFSTIRMTVMTLTVTTCAGIIAWKGMALFLKDSDQNTNTDLNAFGISILVLWVAGLVVFWLFTMETYKQTDRQQLKRPLLPSSSKDRDKANPRRFDGASLVVGLLNITLVLIGILKFEPCNSIGVALGLFGVLGLCFPVWLLLRKRKIEP